ncbi:metallophosphoesterase [Reichenbachiella carrageenanivorans]|uniref:Metallophosphoesterase n=1 Tax=Reichenbachiella carrageenanivorans TaxID=2979869 RepID=A0ABY6D3Z2_9BACT|nr:metallophosphoesterase [Reichenbachiella carrageenanivorans]UXX79783.1 metallophosphoesterase [Reichenbachiella carrageenanivorans]
MKIQYASDLHLEFDDNYQFLLENKLKPVAPYLILAGDIDIISNGTVTRLDFFKYLSENWKEVYIIPGNHEFYKKGNVAASFSLELTIHPNVRYLNHQVITIEGVDLIFSTLWSRTNTSLIKSMISDFNQCKYDDGPFKYKQHDELHARAVRWLNHQLSLDKERPRIVVSHFVPCQQANGYPQNDGDYKQSIMNRYFVADLENRIRDWDIDYWIYGHNHWDKDIDALGVKFRSNQLGYVFTAEHNGFDIEKVIEI